VNVCTLPSSKGPGHLITPTTPSIIKRVTNKYVLMIRSINLQRFLTKLYLMILIFIDTLSRSQKLDLTTEGRDTFLVFS